MAGDILSRAARCATAASGEIRLMIGGFLEFTEHFDPEEEIDENEGDLGPYLITMSRLSQEQVRGCIDRAFNNREAYIEC